MKIFLLAVLLFFTGVSQASPSLVTFSEIKGQINIDGPQTPFSISVVYLEECANGDTLGEASVPLNTDGTYRLPPVTVNTTSFGLNCDRIRQEIFVANKVQRLPIFWKDIDASNFHPDTSNVNGAVHYVRLTYPLTVKVNFHNLTLNEYVKEVLESNPELAVAVKRLNLHWELSSHLFVGSRFGAPGYEAYNNTFQYVRDLNLEKTSECWYFSSSCWASPQIGSRRTQVMSMNPNPKELWITNGDFEIGFVQYLAGIPNGDANSDADQEPVELYFVDDNRHDLFAHAQVASVTVRDLPASDKGTTVDVNLQDPKTVKAVFY